MAGTHQQVIVRMPTDLHEAIKERAEAQDLSMAQAIRAAVRRYLTDAPEPISA